MRAFFKIETIERIRECTYKVYVDRGKAGKLRIVVYPGTCMQVLSDDAVIWLQSDLTDAQQTKIRHAIDKFTRAL